MSAQTILFPAKKEMERRLVQVCPTSSYVEEKFFPELLAHAGETLRPAEVVALFHRALLTCCSKTSLETKAQLLDLVPFFVDAVVDDRDLATEITERVLARFESS